MTRTRTSAMDPVRYTAWAPGMVLGVFFFEKRLDGTDALTHHMGMTTTGSGRRCPDSTLTGPILLGGPNSAPHRGKETEMARLVQISEERENNGYHDSDFSVRVVDMDTGEQSSHLVGSTRFAGGISYAGILRPSELSPTDRARFEGLCWGEAIKLAEARERTRVERPYSDGITRSTPQPGDRVRLLVPVRNRNRESATCPKCGGSGEWVNPRNQNDKRKCFACDGKGVQSKPTKGMHEVPAGTRGTVVFAAERRSQYGTWGQGWTIRVRCEDGSEFNCGKLDALRLDEEPDFRNARVHAVSLFKSWTAWVCRVSGRSA